MFNSIDEVYSWLYTQRKSQKRENLDRIRSCAIELNVMPSYDIIHIAGTNGKGSVAQAIKSTLALTNLHVGLFVSPFVISFNERIQINDRYISNAEIMHYAGILYDYSEMYKKKTKDVIPFFELTLLMALMYFKDRAIDLAVIECGLGGLLDATNFLDSKLPIITNIGFDHMQQLGSTLESISDHKLGIVKEGQTLLTAVDTALVPHFLDNLRKKNANMVHVLEDVADIYVDDYTHFKYKNEEYCCSLLGEYQAYNMALAIEAIRYIDPTIPYSLIDYSLRNLKWAGRMEILQKSPLILLDGGHNLSAILATKKVLEGIRGNRRIKVIFTALVDKDYKSMISVMDSYSDFYYFTSLEDTRKCDAHVFSELTNKPYVLFDSPDAALDDAITSLKEDEILFITGSLHFVSAIREIFLKKNNYKK